MHKRLEERLRKPFPKHCPVVSDSTPVLSFGDFLTASTFSLGINPSNLEFLSRAGTLLLNGEARFESMKSLGVNSLTDAPLSALERIHHACASYFVRNPYRAWFDILEEQILSVGASYYGSSAAHVDLSQWATREKWKEVDKHHRNALISDGRSFLEWQLSLPNVKYLLLNGRTVLTEFERWSGVVYSREKIQGPAKRMAEVVEAKLPSGIKVIGWSTNLQSSHGVTRDFRCSLAKIIKEIACS